MSAADLTANDILSQLQTITNIETVNDFIVAQTRIGFNSFDWLS